MSRDLRLPPVARTIRARLNYLPKSLMLEARLGARNQSLRFILYQYESPVMLKRQISMHVHGNRVMGAKDGNPTPCQRIMIHFR